MLCCLSLIPDFTLPVVFLQRDYKMLSKSYIFQLYTLTFHLSECGLGVSNIWKMTTSNNLSSCAGCYAQFTFFFSTVAELQLSVRWPNVIEAPYKQSNVIFQAFILWLWLDREWPWRDGIWIGVGCLGEVTIDREIEGHNYRDKSKYCSSFDESKDKEGKKKSSPRI